jgi:hypothetical protein
MFVARWEVEQAPAKAEAGSLREWKERKTRAKAKAKAKTTETARAEADSLRE